MAEASTSATREGHPSDTDRVAPTGEKDMKGDEMYQQIHLVEMIVSSKRQLLENVTRIIAVQRKGIQPSDLQAFKEELCKERDHLNTLKLNLNEYRLQLIGKEKEQVSELSAGKQEWAFNREQRQWLYLRRELLYEKQKLRDVSQAGGQASTQELPGEEKHSELDYSDKPLAALKRLKAAEAGLADELTFIQRSSEEDLSRAGRPAILFHFEQLVWHQRMWVCNLEEVLPGQETDVGSEKQGRIVTELRKVVVAQKELIKILEDALEQRKVPGRQFKMAEIQSGTTKELVELISEQTRLVEASDPVQEYSGELQRVDLMVEEFACINVRWEVIFEHQRLRGHRRQPLQKAVVESVEMLRQQVYALGLNHREIYQPLDIRLDLEEDILLKQMTFWGGVIESYWAWLSWNLDAVPEAGTGTRTREFVGQGASSSSVQPAVGVEGFGSPGISIEDDRVPDQGDSQVLGLGMIDGSALPIIGQLHSSQPPKFSDDAFLLDDSSSDSTPSPPTSPAYLPSDSRELPKDDASTRPTRLQLILQEHDKQIAGLSDSELQESIFQLPYIAISYFNEMGGSLSLKEYNVHLYIPRDALPAGSLQKVYIYVNPNAPPIDGLGGQDIPLSPMIQCGPTGLQFRDRVVLSFPHHAKEGTGWNFSAHICSNDEDDSKTWQAMDSQDDGILVSTKNQKAVLLMSHFCGAALTSQDQSVAKIVKVGTFGADLDLSEDWYPVRIHLWNNDPVAEKNVMDTELRHDVSSQQLDVPRDLEVVFNQGDVQVEIGNVSEGWQAEDAQTILKSRIWKYCTNSVTFDFERQSHCEKSLHCKGYVCQVGPPEASNARTEDKVKLRIRPRRTKNVKPDENEMRVQDQPSADSKENLDGARVKKEPGKMYGDYGGLSPQALQDIGKRLEAGDGADQLTDESLTGARLIAMISFMEVFKLFFADQRASQVSDKDAVKSLRQTLKRKGFEVSEMLWEEGLESDSNHNKRDSRSLSEDVASSEIAEQQRLWKLSRQLEAEWEELATYLGITSAELFRIKSDHAGNVGNQMHAMLDLWWRKGRPDSELVEALREVERHDLAEQVQEHQQQQQEQQQQQQQQQQPLNGNTFHEIE
ncbi:uncharacterized protein LOC119735688 isoform X2 [Patiria miniata]|uniref:Netrin receptor UNC5 n=1 Tax=Patiria miniata TaxID=46514 RepID=A0A914APU1_PATMI|nr:uncharacterized protein LOC119735688 isoform X2 [Patiria miniata]